MKIAQIAPTWYPLSTDKYGGIERVVSGLTNDLVRLGHEVSLYASKDSETDAKLIPTVYDAPKEIWRKGRNDYIFSVARAVEEEKNYDILHFHAGVDILPLVLSLKCKKPVVVTFHNSFEVLMPYYQHFLKNNYISVSDSLRLQFPHGMNFIKTVYNGIDISPYRFSSKVTKDLAYLGRTSEDKGLKEAIEVTIKGNWRLEMGIKLPEAPEEINYYNKDVAPLLKKHKRIKVLGEIGDKEKNKLLGSSRVFLYPINWQEPFGLVLVEAMACGTPVVATACGAIPEIIEDGKTGFIVPKGDINKLVEAVKKVYSLSDTEYLNMRKLCRETVEKKYTTTTMTNNYLAVYEEVIYSHKYHQQHMKYLISE